MCKKVSIQKQIPIQKLRKYSYQNDGMLFGVRQLAKTVRMAIKNYSQKSPESEADW